MSEALEHGPGWCVDRSTVRPRITDLAALRADHADDPYLEVLERLWGGDPAGAEGLLRADGGPSDFRGRALLADSLSAQGRHEEGLAAWRLLLQGNRVPGRRSWLLHHLGCALLAAGHPAEAMTPLAEALSARDAVGTAEAAATTRHALAIARSRSGL